MAEAVAVARGIRAVPAERLSEEAERIRSLPPPMRATALRSVLCVPQRPYFRTSCRAPRSSGSRGRDRMTIRRAIRSP